MLLPFTTALISFALATFAVGWLSRRRLALDQPNARSLHDAPVPRTGGLGLILGTAAGWAIAAASLPWPVWLGLALVIGVSLADDLRGVPAALRLLVHLIAAMAAAWAVLDAGTSAPVVLLAALATAWMCNLYNFMDGSDGLAGGMALIGFLAYAAAAWFTGNHQFGLLNLAVAAAAGGFLVHNFHPARIFLGDSGAVPLGFIAAVFGMAGWHGGHWSWWFPLLVFSPFIVDASVTLARRLFSGVRVWEAHRDHYYQRLVQLGLGHRGTALAEYLVMAGCAVLALASMGLEPAFQSALLAGIGVMYLALIAAIEMAWRRRVNGA